MPPTADQPTPPLSFKPVYKKKTFLQSLPGRIARTITTPLVGTAGAAAGGIGLGLAGLLAGGALGHYVSPSSELPLKDIGNPGMFSGPNAQQWLEGNFKNLGSSIVNALGGPSKLQGTGIGAGLGLGAGTLAGSIGGGLGGAYLGHRVGGGGKPPELERLVMENPNESKSKTKEKEKPKEKSKPKDDLDMYDEELFKKASAKVANELMGYGESSSSNSLSSSSSTSSLNSLSTSASPMGMSSFGLNSAIPMAPSTMGSTFPISSMTPSSTPAIPGVNKSAEALIFGAVTGKIAAHRMVKEALRIVKGK